MLLYQLLIITYLFVRFGVELRIVQDGSLWDFLARCINVMLRTDTLWIQGGRQTPIYILVGHLESIRHLVTKDLYIFN